MWTYNLGEVIVISTKHYYDPLTGVVSNAKGKPLGSFTRKYGRIAVNGRPEYIHKYIFFLVEGVWPDCEVDHKDLDTHNNRWGNLRKCSRQKNMCNKGAYKNSKSGYKGVYLDRGKFVATIQCDGKRLYLGRSSSAEECAVMYDEAATRLHGEFANLNFKEGKYN